MHTRTITYKSRGAMQRDIPRWERKGWTVQNIVESKDHGLTSCVVILLALTIVGLLLLPLLLFTARKTYMVTYAYVGSPSEMETPQEPELGSSQDIEPESKKSSQTSTLIAILALIALSVVGCVTCYAVSSF